MRRLLQVLYRLRAFFVFMLLELICFWFIYHYNSFQRVSMMNSSNAVSGTVFSLTSGVRDYFSLKSQNEELADQMTRLMDSLQYYQQQQNHFEELKLTNQLLHEKVKKLQTDSAKGEVVYDPFDYWNNYTFIPAKVIKNEILKEENYITLNKGTKDGLHPGMGVISSEGIVGKVISCSKRYATVKSVLHLNNSVSAQVKRNRSLGSLAWRGRDFTHAELEYIPRHVTLQKNDTVVTSGYNSIYPENINVGVIDSLHLEPHNTFHQVRVQLSTDFSKLYYVYVVDNLKWEGPDSTMKVAIP